MRTSNELSSLDMVKKLFLQYGIRTRLGDIYDHFDLITENNWLLEVKNRRLNYDQFIEYNKSGFIMENIKYNYLINYNSRYINTFVINGLEFILNWNVKDIDSKSINMECKKTTDFNNNNYINKEIILLKAEDAKIYIWENDKYVVIDYHTLINKLNGSIN